MSEQQELPLELDPYPGCWRVTITYPHSIELPQVVWFRYEDKAIARKFANTRPRPYSWTMELDPNFVPEADEEEEDAAPIEFD